MSLVDDVSSAITEAMRQKDAGRLSALRMLKAALMNKSVEKGHDLDDSEARQVVTALVKQRRDSIEQFQKGGRQDLVDKEAAEVTVIQEYMPARLSEAEILSLIAEAIAKTGATSGQDMGKVMGILKPQLQGKADMGEVSKLVKSRLN